MAGERRRGTGLRVGQAVSVQIYRPRLYGAAPPIGVLSTDGPIFRMDGQPWRYKGRTAFKLCEVFRRGDDIDLFLAESVGANVLRVFAYTPEKDWGAGAWDVPDIGAALAFFDACAARGLVVEWVLLTDDDPAQLDPAARFVDELAAARPSNVVLEIGNEPMTHKTIDTAALRDVCERSGLLYSSGDYEDSNRFFGRYLTAHTPRDDEWPRKAHDLLEYYGGGGPNAPSDPAHKVPCVADEPIRPDQAHGDLVGDFRAYFGTCAILGGGATFHCETGKYGDLFTEDEAVLFRESMWALDAFPADAPKGPYRRIDEHGGSLRTYVVGDCMTRVRPVAPEAPEPGWVALDDRGILWRRG